jgi:hypothetical protein
MLSTLGDDLSGKAVLVRPWSLDHFRVQEDKLSLMRSFSVYTRYPRRRSMSPGFATGPAVVLIAQLCFCSVALPTKTVLAEGAQPCAPAKNASAEIVRGVEDDPQCEFPSKTPSRRAFQSIAEQVKHEVRRTDDLVKGLLEPLTRDLYAGFSTRVMGQLVMRVDHLHGRCWFDDQLSCSMLESSLHELRGLVERLTPQHLLDEAAFDKKSPALEKRVIELRSVASELNAQCKKLPWNLG